MTKLLEIDELGSGDCFGDDSLLNGENGEGVPMIHSVVTSTPSEIFVLDEHDFHNLGEKIRVDFILNRKNYPDDKEIWIAMIEMKKWEKFKWDLVTNIQADK